MKTSAATLKWLKEYLTQKYSSELVSGKPVSPKPVLEAASQAGHKVRPATVSNLVSRLRKRSTTALAVIKAPQVLVEKKERRRMPSPTEAVTQLRSLALHTQQFIKQLGFSGLMIPAEGQITFTLE